MLNKNTLLERTSSSSVSLLGHHPGKNCSTWTPGNKDKDNEHMFIKVSSLKDSTIQASGVTSRGGSRGAGDPPSQKTFSQMS